MERDRLNNGHGHVGKHVPEVFVGKGSKPILQTCRKQGFANNNEKSKKIHDM